MTSAVMGRSIVTRTNMAPFPNTLRDSQRLPRLADQPVAGQRHTPCRREHPVSNPYQPEQTAFVFPGQGSQVVGMARALHDTSAAARQIFARADAALGRSIRDLCFDGPDTVLNDTANAQPALLTASIATLEAMRERGFPIQPALVAGHSLGEFTAVVAAGSLDFETGLRLVEARGALMRQAGEDRPGGMAAILGLDDDAVRAVCEEASADGIVNVANLNCPGQVVISGETAPLERAITLAAARGARRAIRLPVSIASHSPLMADVSRRLGELLADAPIREPEWPLVANITAAQITTVDEIRTELANGVQRPVNWTASVTTMIGAGVTTFIEVGPGNILGGLIKRISCEVTNHTGENLLAEAARVHGGDA